MFNDTCAKALKRVFKLNKITPVLFIGRNGWQACFDMQKLQVPCWAVETPSEAGDRRTAWDGLMRSFGGIPEIKTIEAFAWTASGQYQIRTQVNPSLAVTIDMLPILEDREVVDRCMRMRPLGTLVHYVSDIKDGGKHTPEQWKALVGEDYILDGAGKLL